MDWSQASQLELIVFGEGILITCLLLVGIIGALAWCVYDFTKEKVARIKRLKKTTRALRCDVCIHNVYDNRNFRECEKFGCSISFAPVICPGCSWGIEKQEGGDD
jgi:hypothetical protein